ncbi:MAG: hypothetical protein HDR83_04905 [Bacteroides sp.]|nr:hypothetical protein [Bacteroidales bacterium]MBD5252790.1 hypothetical protein [Barnesiella sp.]MBD5368587.1 hypothetical protein [Bacteroides sp.]
MSRYYYIAAPQLTREFYVDLHGLAPVVIDNLVPSALHPTPLSRTILRVAKRQADYAAGRPQVSYTLPTEFTCSAGVYIMAWG